MRIAAIAILLSLAGCGLSPAWNEWYVRKSAERNAEVARVEASRQAYLRTPDGQAERVCGYRARAAVAGRVARSLFDLEGEAIVQQQFNSCMGIYRSTGRVP